MKEIFGSSLFVEAFRLGGPYNLEKSLSLLRINHNMELRDNSSSLRSFSFGSASKLWSKQRSQGIMTSCSWFEPYLITIWRAAQPGEEDPRLLFSRRTCDTTSPLGPTPYNNFIVYQVLNFFESCSPACRGKRLGGL